jgi:NADH-quinone oxidoreductase subunit L
MTLTVTIVALAIMLYSTEYMVNEEGYSRFFAYMNLFVAAMLILVLADDMLFLYLGWEGVGCCSYLLIGFWYKDPVNVRAGRKAFCMTRIGDTALLAGMFFVYLKFGTLDIAQILHKAQETWNVGCGAATIVSFLLLIAALGKSAQLPLQTWLPDAMAGPTPVSALIHAATMVTAGVYLIVRMNPVFLLAPFVMHCIAVIGTATLLTAGMAAMAQRDIKRALAYSTISQIGYMFLALGVGAFTAALFHFVVHAFIKSLLFLAAGVVIQSLMHEQDMFKMGGVRRELWGAFWAFMIGAASLSALPLITAGFYSKDFILFSAWTSDFGGGWLWACGVFGAMITAFYAFRMVFLVFFGPLQKRVAVKPKGLIALSLAMLCIPALFVGFIQTPPPIADIKAFSDFVSPIAPGRLGSGGAWRVQLVLQAIAVTASLSGAVVAWLFYVQKPRFAEGMKRTAPGAALVKVLYEGFGFDKLYETMIVKPFIWVTYGNQGDYLVRYMQGARRLAQSAHTALSFLQNGKLRWYMAALALGAAIILAIGALL